MNAIRAAGFSAGPEPLPNVLLESPVVVTGKGGAFIAAYPSDILRFTVAVSFDHPLVGTQIARFESYREDYSASIAPARTLASSRK